ncbi:hypothetical protein C482_13660 [Natrialba chahannaoensis JCM 10990]|uniref:Oligogalacturonate lyase domain-containing protein n=1 Tax=Natrialba chahannaoensis JCM 10990 TaxID=1227492 RepID=M0AFG1_9EURY|nr:hypothetical protein C482_13660 [Natrialba chahannaoensis JCM 10990]
MSFNPLERKIAEALNRFPVLKQTTKALYQRTNYFVFGNRDFTSGVHTETELLTPAEYVEVTSFSGPEFFGYFDTTPWNRNGDSLIYHRPTTEPGVSIQLYQNGRSQSIATSAAWNYQQGCRTRWHPTETDHVVYNDILDGSLAATVVDTTGTTIQTYDRPLQAMAPTGQEFISLNYHRLDRNRPDYGYGIDDETKIAQPTDDGLWKVETETNTAELLISLAELIDNEVAQEDHYLNHVLYNPAGDRFVFLHRWRGPQGRVSRLYVSDRDGNYRLLMDDDVVSHYCWLDETQVLVWGRSKQHGDGYHKIDVETGEQQFVHPLDGYGDGHPSVSPNGRWVVTDTYPDRGRRRHLLLFDQHTDTVTELGQFFSPFGYEGENRCDLHPRWSPDGTKISIDSAHDGTRRSYILDVSALVSDSSRRNVR